MNDQAAQTRTRTSQTPAEFLPLREASCRCCGAQLDAPFLSLGMTPLANSYLRPSDLNSPEPLYPLEIHFCDGCGLVQLGTVASAEEIFGTYAYFSSYSDSWVEHARIFAAKAVRQFQLGAHSKVVEVASNDGYLLRHFVQAGVPVLGIEPARNVAEVAIASGIPTESVFFGAAVAQQLAASGRRADLLIGNNVLAHVPQLNDFVYGLKLLLAPRGVLTMEFPHVVRLVENNEFDTIYHEHFSYFSLIAVERLFAVHGLVVWDVEELPTHGGSLRVYAQHREDCSRSVTRAVDALRSSELAKGYNRRAIYDAFAARVRDLRSTILGFFERARHEGKNVAGYGAPAKATTLLNYCGVQADLLPYTVDRSPHKQGCFLPGTRIPIYAPERIAEAKPHYIVILAWNLKEEVGCQLAYTRAWGAQLITLIPCISIF